MAAPEVMTFTSLSSDVPSYAERANDTAFVAQVPRFIMLAEARIADEARGLGQIESVQDVLVVGQAGSALAKPAQWRESASLSIGTGATFKKRKALKMRSYEYCRFYAPDETLLDEPRYYADWNWQNFLISPSPDLAYPYELLYFRKPPPLSASQTTNWTTQYAPQLILYATLLEASTWVKNDALVQGWQAQYDRALKQVESGAKRRLADRTASPPTSAGA